MRLQISRLLQDASRGIQDLEVLVRQIELFDVLVVGIGVEVGVVCARAGTMKNPMRTATIAVIRMVRSSLFALVH